MPDSVLDSVLNLVGTLHSRLQKQLGRLQLGPRLLVVLAVPL